MIYVVIGAIIASAVLLQWWLAGVLLGKLDRQHRRERELLVNQIMHLSNRTWAPPPADAEDLEPSGLERPLALVEPEQETDY